LCGRPMGLEFGCKVCVHGGGSMSSTESLSYRSPVAKLLRFFRRSRNRWKDKCKTAKRENKSLKTRLAKMKESRDRWKAEARGMRETLQSQTASVEEVTKSDEAGRARGGQSARRRA
jgi:hypothetical protein